MTAWLSRVARSLICLSVNGRTSVRRIMIAPMDTPSRRERRDEDRARAANLLVCSGFRKLGVEFCHDVMDVNRFPV